MKIKKCPYCGRKITYSSALASRQRGEYRCVRCGKESKVVIDKKIFMVFAVFFVIALAIMFGWIALGNISNPFGIILVAVPFVIFTLISTKFLSFEPLKKYKKSMEARKAGIEYSDNLASSELESGELGGISENDTGFKINSDVFNKIKAERVAARQNLEDEKDITSNSRTIAVEKPEEKYVPIKGDVSQSHKYVDTPLKKIHTDRDHSRTYHTLDENPSESKNVSEKKNENRYSANRKF